MIRVRAAMRGVGCMKRNRTKIMMTYRVEKEGMNLL